MQIFNAVYHNQFKLICTCESTKAAYVVLQTAYEGMDTIRLSRLRFSTTKSENLKMLEEETVSLFDARLFDIVNEAFILGVKISEEKLVKKTLRSFLKRFAYKVTAIEEAKDVRNMRLEELMGPTHF